MVRTLPGRCCLASRCYRPNAAGWGLWGPLHTAVWPQALGTPVPGQPCVRQAQPPPGASGCLLIRRVARSSKGKERRGLGTCKATSQTDGSTDTLSDPPPLGRTAGKGWARVSRPVSTPVPWCTHVMPPLTAQHLAKAPRRPFPVELTPAFSYLMGNLRLSRRRERGSGLLLCRVLGSLGQGGPAQGGGWLLPVLYSLLPLDLKLRPV